MPSVSVPEAVKPITLLALAAACSEWLCFADSMMARALRPPRPNTRMQPLRSAGIDPSERAAPTNALTLHDGC